MTLIFANYTNAVFSIRVISVIRLIRVRVFLIFTADINHI